MDGASSHTNEEFLRVFYSKNILPFRLPPHTTLLLQPLNLVCFQPLKQYQSEAVDSKVRNGDYEFSKIEFLARISSIRSQAFKQNTIRESFRQTGLIPLNLEIVMQKLRDLSSPTSVSDLLLTPLTPSRVTQEKKFHTSTTVQAFNLHASALTNPDNSPSSRNIVQDKYVKGTLAKINSGELAEDQLRKNRVAELERASSRREKIPDRRANEVVVAQRAPIQPENAAHNAVVGPWLSMFKEGSEVKVTFKQAYKVKRAVSVGLFKELSRYVKQGKSGDVPLERRLAGRRYTRGVVLFAGRSSLKDFLL